MANLDIADDQQEPLRCACIDCGTNSIKLVIADLTASYARPVFAASVTSRIGEAMQANGMRLREAPMRRTLDALVTFADDLGRFGVVDSVLIGTAALRDAHNSEEFAERARDRTGLKLEIISGEEEARLSYLAVRRDPKWRSKPRLLAIDIGGGSTEIIQGEEGTDRIRSRVSVNIGAVKLTEAFLRSDPPTVTQLAAANQAVELAFASVSVLGRSGEPYHAVGVGGTLTNLGAMYLGAFVESERLHGLAIEVSALESMRARLAVQTVAQRRTTPGLNPERADIILAGAILLTHALAHIRSDRVEVSTRGLRWGVLYDRFMPQGALN